MSRGGARPGAGRPAGSTNKRSEALREALAENGGDPVLFMLEIMRDIKRDISLRMDAAKSVAPYVHPKLQATTVTGADGGPVKVVIGTSDAGLL